MIITVTEFRRHVDHYLDLSKYEDIYLTKYGKIISVLHYPKKYHEKNEITYIK